jgi:hypothetical protein
MDLLLYRRYQRGGGEQAFAAWELSEGLDDWDSAPAPAQVGRRVVEGFLQTELPANRARMVNNVVHWLYGVSWGAQYGVLAGTRGRSGPLAGAVFGSGVWSSGYVVLPLAGLYQPIWEYDAATLAKDWSGHLAFGVTTAVIFRALSL